MKSLPLYHTFIHKNAARRRFGLLIIAFWALQSSIVCFWIGILLLNLAQHFWIKFKGWVTLLLVWLNIKDCFVVEFWWLGSGRVQDDGLAGVGWAVLVCELLYEIGWYFLVLFVVFFLHEFFFECWFFVAEFLVESFYSMRHTA